jgi:hypothetical protein
MQRILKINVIDKKLKRVADADGVRYETTVTVRLSPVQMGEKYGTPEGMPLSPGVMAMFATDRWKMAIAFPMTFTGIAKLHPNDTEDPKIGAELSEARAHDKVHKWISKLASDVIAVLENEIKVFTERLGDVSFEMRERLGRHIQKLSYGEAVEEEIEDYTDPEEPEPRAESEGAAADA